MNKHASPHSSAAATLLLLILLSGCIDTAVAADSSTIDLTDQPVATGSTIPPNILVAVDNSGSMDFETLFSTTEGELYVKGSSPYTRSDGDLNSPSSRNAYGYTRYAYLFPNGYRYSGYDSTKGKMLYDRDYPIPPTTQFAFARSSKYNKSYFDPNNHYSHWINTPSQSYPDRNSPEKWHNAPYDPTQNAGTLDLIDRVKKRGDGQEFYFTDGMDASYISYYNGSEWADTQRATSAQYQFLAIQYYPATFYMPNSWTPPADFGWTGNYDALHNDSSTDNYEPTYGDDPAGNPTLKRYKIIRGNFDSNAAYKKAMTNFANWFTYYRKRNLAIRGGITAAFDKIGDVRVGSCSINTAESRASNNDYQELTMKDLSDGSARSQFYRSIYNLDFYQALGTPNRSALYYLGRELDENNNIITSPCQRNYAILFTDGYNSNAGPDVGNVDGKYGDDNPAIPDDYRNTIADIAMRFYQELRPDYIGNSGGVLLPTGCPDDPSLDCESKLHMSTYGVTLGLSGAIFGNTADFPQENAEPYSHPPPWYLDRDGNAIGGNTLRTGGIQEIDDLWHATINTRGALLEASSPQDIANKFSAALGQILGQNETLTNATGNSTSLTADSVIYQTNYSVQNSTGDLIAFHASNSSNEQGDLPWSAAKKLKDQLHDKGPDHRTIITAVRNGGDVEGKAFTHDALDGQNIDGLNAATIAYLRGDRAKEQTGASDDASQGRIYRQRGDTVLGDIINSVPAYVGRPNPLKYVGHWKDKLHPEDSTPENEAAYYQPGDSNSFVSQHPDREPMVYVGANDGMLHGFDAKTGEEKLAFIPNAVLGSLAGGNNPLTGPSYKHRAFVDGQIATGPAFFGGKWHTMLVGSLRNGGNTIYALDITEPDNFKQSNAGNLVRWEFSAPELGKTFGKPSIVRLHNGKWAAIFANGYNSSDFGASLYVVDMATGDAVDMATGDQIGSLTTGATPSGDEPGNGLATPFPADIDGDYITDYVYAGDLYGNVWRFDLTSSNPGSWTGPNHPLFQATNNGRPQPITTQVQVAAHPNGINYGVMVYFGTGQDIRPLDANQGAIPNNFYGVWDPDVFSYNPGGNAPAAAPSDEVARSELVTQTVSPTELDNGDSGLSYRTVTDTPITYIDAKGNIENRGWVINLPKNSGEAVLNPPEIVDDNVQFSTAVIDRQTCSLTSSGYFMAVNRANGGPATRDLFDVNGDGVVDGKDASPQRVAGVGLGPNSGSAGRGVSYNDQKNGTQVVKMPLTRGGIKTITMARDFLSGRRSWHEIRR